MHELEYVALVRGAMRRHALHVRDHNTNVRALPIQPEASAQGAEALLVGMELEAATSGTIGVRDDFVEFIRAAAEKMPEDWKLHRTLAPLQIGALVFENHHLEVGVDIDELAVLGLMWKVWDEGLFFVPFGTTPEGITTYGAFGWEWGQTIAGVRETVRGYQWADGFDPTGLCKMFAATCLFVAQRILVVEEARLSRAQRRRQEREDDDYSHLRVIALRRNQRLDRHEGEPSEVDWQWRWVVSGHWRMQWHPSTRQHVPTWIMPYIKGPDGKPLKPAGDRVFQVVR